ncbi:MAG: MopE-related protein, partial [Myxococcota bacterium]
MLLALSLPLGLLIGCQNEVSYEEIKYPVLGLGQASLEFGEVEWGGSVERTVILSNDGDMPMGIGSIAIGEALVGNDTSFTVAWDAAAVECSGTTDEEPVETDTDGDTAAGGDTGSSSVSEGDGIVGDALFVVGPGCRIPLTVTYAPVANGHAYDSLVVTTVGTALTEEEEDAGQDFPSYDKDPIRTTQAVYLHGQSEYVQGTVVVRPRSVDFGFVHPNSAADEAPARIRITNVGDGTVSVTGASLADTCDGAFRLLTEPATGELSADQSTLAEVSFTPSGTRRAVCELTVTTTDPANPTIAVSLVGNATTSLQNNVPTVAIRSPENGFHYTTDRPLTLELNIFDLDQPADTLDCRVKSGVLLLETVATCTPSDESGHVYVEVPPESLMAGTDTIIVSVTDASMETAYAAVSILVNAEYPADDDDGDGFSASGEPADCDDSNRLSYPEASELFDRADNNCDGVVDEGTEGYDDDDDGFSEADGDCNDRVATVFPGASEDDDALDNDCDGTVDEVTTNSDDDGDGYSENDYDCDDGDPNIHPGATEECDGFDNDCDGLRDGLDGCVATETDPVIVGNLIEMAQTACLEGEQIAMSVLVNDADGDAVAYQWSADDATATFNNTISRTVNFTCPEIEGDDAGNGRYVNIYTLAADTDGGQDWATGQIAVWDGA